MQRWRMLLGAVLCAGLACGQGTAKAEKRAYFTSVYDAGLTAALEHFLLKPAADGSAEAAAELAEMHRVEKTRTAAEVKSAQYDDAHEDVFAYAGTVTAAGGQVAGELFAAKEMPLLAAFAGHLRGDAALIDGPLKNYFHRLRPYQFDTSLHPVCATNKEFSYPSGHSINGYLYGYLLTEILPEESDRLLARAQGYADHRVVCGVHYPSDTEASRRVASIVFGYLMAQPRFQSDLQAARREVRSKLGFAGPE